MIFGLKFDAISLIARGKGDGYIFRPILDGKGGRFIIHTLGPTDACQLTAISVGASLLAKSVRRVPRCTTTVLRPHRQVELRHARAR